MPKKRLNKNVVISLTMFTFIMIIVVSVLTLGQLKRRDPKHFVELARQHADKEEWRTAAVF
ncbi:MAG: hypothetical protein IID41_17340 [Planctomycetes bacterium]|nr:hypothetical protein [Planctomycetota bacterium]